jgi:hypothetical protein
MNQNFIYKDLFGQALTNMKSSSTHTEPQTQSDKPAEFFRLLWGIYFVDLLILLLTT